MKACNGMAFIAVLSVSLCTSATHASNYVAAEKQESDCDSVVAESAQTDGRAKSLPCDDSSSCKSNPPSDSWASNLSFFAGIEGSKQPQDFGVNANLGGRVAVDWGVPVIADSGLGLQIGTAINSTANAVRVDELLGESTNRFQSFTTVGLFQRTSGGFSWGFGYDFLYEDSFDKFDLGQWRVRAGQLLNNCNEVGVTAQIGDQSDSGFFNTTRITLAPITQGSIYARHFWPTGVQTSCWLGIAEGHGEANAVTGPSPAKKNEFLLGADVFAPLNSYLAIYGETNLMMPPDTGTVDAFLGVELFPNGRACRARRETFSPVLPVAGSTSFSLDLKE